MGQHERIVNSIWVIDLGGTIAGNGRPDPAIRPARGSTGSRHDESATAGNNTGSLSGTERTIVAKVVSLYLYPVKGLSPQEADRLAVTPDAGLGDDRRYALALGSTNFAPDDPAPLDKRHFLMLQRNESLAALKTRVDTVSAMMSIETPSGEQISADFGDPQGRALVEDFFWAYAGKACEGRPRLVEAAGHKFTDVSVVSPEMMKAVSVINLASVRDLGEREGRAIDPLRFRANIYVDGLPAWDELGWVGRAVSIGSAQFHCAMVTKRCAAIDVAPSRGVRDMHLPKALMAHYGHPNCGIYLEITAAGSFACGDAIAARPNGLG